MALVTTCLPESVRAKAAVAYPEAMWRGLRTERDGRLAAFKTAKVIEFENAGHWLHHDQFDRFITTLRDFL